MVAPYTVMMGLILVLTPLVCWLFSLGAKDGRVPFGKWGETIHSNRYYLHIFGYAIIIKWKGLTDAYNEPIKNRTGNWTEFVYAIEGNLSRTVQQTFENDFLTDILAFHYLFIYLFLIYVTTVFYAFVGERDLTDKVTMNYLFIYAIAVPYYLFFNVEVTSSWIPEMNALIYHDSWYADFYITHDPLDNAVPSLHVAIPFGILLLNWLHVKERGGKMREWEHWPYHLFILANTVLFCFSIIYLGIHWVVDIPLGMIVGAIGAFFIHYIQPRLRNDFGNWGRGVDDQKVRKHAVAEGMMTAGFLALLLLAVSYQTATIDDRASFRLGEDDTTFEIIQELKGGETVTTRITNLDDDRIVYVTTIELYDSLSAMERDGIKWDAIVEEAGGFDIITPNAQLNYTFTEQHQWYLIIFHVDDAGDDGVVELNVENTYSNDELVPALIMSIFSLWITSFILYRMYRLKKAGLPIICSLPSHTWEYHSEES